MAPTVAIAAIRVLFMCCSWWWLVVAARWSMEGQTPTSGIATTSAPSAPTTMTTIRTRRVIRQPSAYGATVGPRATMTTAIDRGEPGNASDAPDAPPEVADEAGGDEHGRGQRDERRQHAPGPRPVGAPRGEGAEEHRRKHDRPGAGEDPEGEDACDHAGHGDARAAPRPVAGGPADRLAEPERREHDDDGERPGPRELGVGRDEAHPGPGERAERRAGQRADHRPSQYGPRRAGGAVLVRPLGSDRRRDHTETDGRASRRG